METISTGEWNMADNIRFYNEVAPDLKAVGIKLTNGHYTMAGLIRIEDIPVIVELLLNAYNRSQTNIQVDEVTTPEVQRPETESVF